MINSMPKWNKENNKELLSQLISFQLSKKENGECGDFLR
jgi:hypothetical protein